MEKKAKTPKKEHKAQKTKSQKQEISPPPRKQGSVLSVDNTMLIIAILGIVLTVFVTFNVNIMDPASAIAIVNGVIITEDEVQAEIAKLPPFYSTSMDEATIRNAVIDQLIAKALLLEQASALGIEVSEEEVTQTIDDLLVQAGITEEEYTQRLEEQGMDDQSIEGIVREQIAINHVIEQEVLASIEVTQDEIVSYFETSEDTLVEVEASHILICYTGATNCAQERSEQEARDFAQELITDITAGANFADLATEHSDDPSAAFNAGALGWFTKGQMVPEFEAAAFGMNPGEVTQEPVETTYGFHVIQVTDKKDSVDDVNDKIVELLTFEKQKTALEEYVESLRADADVVVN